MLKLNDKNVLVTGAAGKLGNYVSEYLHKKGYNVTCTDVVLPKPDSRIAKLKLPFVKGDLLDLGDIMKAIAMAQCGTIVHLGAIPFNVELQPPYDTTPKKGPSCGGVRSNYVMPEDNAMKINTMGTFYVMDAARRMGVKNVIAASSYYCYGLGMRIYALSQSRSTCRSMKIIPAHRRIPTPFPNTSVTRSWKHSAVRMI